MPHVTDGLWNTIFSKLKQARILVMGTTDRMSTKIHVDHLVDAMSGLFAVWKTQDWTWIQKKYKEVSFNSTLQLKYIIHLQSVLAITSPGISKNTRNVVHQQLLI